MMRLLQSSWTATGFGTVAYLTTLIICWRPAVHPPLEPVRAVVSRAAGPSWAFFNPEVDLLIAELKKEKEGLAAKEKELNDLAARLQTEHAEMNQLTQMVQQVQADFDQNVTRVREQETANLKRLAKMYATMTPEGAASVFKEMDDSKVVKVLVVMKESEIGPILEVMARQGDAEAKRVAGLSERLRLSIAEGKKTP